MIIFFILLVLTLAGILLALYFEYELWLLGVSIALVFGIYLIIHTCQWLSATYNYNQFVVKRKAFTETLHYARKNESQLELAAITRDVSEWNQQLASQQYDNTLFLLQDYVDDRIMTLNPIR